MCGAGAGCSAIKYQSLSLPDMFDLPSQNQVNAESNVPLPDMFDM